MVKELGPAPAILLAKLTEIVPAPEVWVYRTQDQLLAETGLSHKIQRRSIKLLKKLGLVATKRKRIEHKCFYKITATGVAGHQAN